MNKEKILKQLGIKNNKESINRLLDIGIKSEREYSIVSTEFNSPDVLTYIDRIIYNFTDLEYVLVGGFEDSEYQKVIFYPNYLTDEDINISDYISIIEISYNEKFGSFSHRDVLGSLMGLGIKREKIGDIILKDNICQIAVDCNIADYILTNINKIGRVTVKSRIISIDEIIKKEYKTISFSSTVKSLRLDSIISSGYKIPRSKASELIKLERVKLNHIFITSASKEISEGDLISVKGMGRIILESVGGLSKKERYKIDIKKFI